MPLFREDGAKNNRCRCSSRTEQRKQKPLFREDGAKKTEAVVQGGRSKKKENRCRC